MRTKRSHREAFADVQALEQQSESQLDEPEQMPVQDSVAADEEKEAQIWDAIKEEYFAVVDQFPLTLQREMTLIGELDQQVHGYYDDLLPTLQKYVSRRLNEPETLPFPVLPAISFTPPCTPSRPRTDKTTLRRLKSTISLTSPHTPGTPMGLPRERLQPPKTNAQLLSHVAFLSEQLIRASEEKVNLARSSCESVDRYIRLLDQSIKEEEASIALGARPGTHLAPIILPELTVPLTKPHNQPMPNSPFADSDDDSESGLHLVAAASVAASRNPSKAGKNGKQKAKVVDTKTAAGKEKLTIRVPPKLPSAQFTVEPVADIGTPGAGEPEPLYCFCQKPSYGDMIMCDDVKCSLEWFHYACVGMNKAPAEDSKWFCANCVETRKKVANQKKRKKGRR